MPISTSAGPYYDDFDSSKNYQQILFKPGYAVQARELTQIQSILRNQIAKFGDHVFKHGSVVIPGNTSSDLTLCYVKLNTLVANTSLFIGGTVVGTSGLKAYIRAVGDPVEVDEYSMLYVAYYNSGTAGEQVFGDSESLTITTASGSVYYNATISSGATGGAATASINNGVFFINGTFVEVLKQEVVISKYSSVPNCKVLLKIQESIVDSDIDNTLLDPAQGSYNYAAPGADRLKITLTLVTLQHTDPVTDDYVELMRYTDGDLEESSRYAKYNELEKSLARRTYDESGDYVVGGLEVKVREHLKESNNDGRYLAPTGDDSKLVYTVFPGKAYIQGFENQKFGKTEVTVDKARTTKTSVTNIVPSYGQYFIVSNVLGLPSFASHEAVNLFNASTGGAQIGTARVLGIDFHESNTTDANSLFKLYVYDITMTGGNDYSSIGRITYTAGAASVCSLLKTSITTTSNFSLEEVITGGATHTAIVQKYNRATNELYVIKNVAGNFIPSSGDIITGGTSLASAKVDSGSTVVNNLRNNLLISLPNSSIYRVKNESNVVDMSYKIYHEATVAISGGAGSFSVSGMTIDPKEQGNFIIIDGTSIKPLSTATVAPDGLSVSFTGVSPASTTIKVICAATKVGPQATAKTKTVVYNFSETLVTPASVITLTRADIIRLKSVVSTIDGDITNRYTLDNGQRDYAYLLGSLKLVGTAPTGTLTITYDYFVHNAGSGDYFSVDSYESSGLADYFASSVLIYKSINTGKKYDLRKSLDFRPRVGNTGLFTAGDGAVLNSKIQIDSRLTTSFQGYVGRIDVVSINKDGTLNVTTGTPAIKPLIPKVGYGSIILSAVVVPAYTYKSSNCRVNKYPNRSYTMNDIGKIDARVGRLEKYVTLNESESSVIDYDIIDATTGLSRYKSGYLVDTFNNPDIISDINNSQFKVTYASGSIIPMFEVDETSLNVNYSECHMMGDVIMLYHNEVVFARQPVSCKVTNVNPFSVFSWVGNLIIAPASESWTEVENLQNIFNSTTEVVITWLPWVEPFIPPIIPPVVVIPPPPVEVVIPPLPPVVIPPLPPVVVDAPVFVPEPEPPIVLPPPEVIQIPIEPPAPQPVIAIDWSALLGNGLFGGNFNFGTPDSPPATEPEVVQPSWVTNAGEQAPANAWGWGGWGVAEGWSPGFNSSGQSDAGNSGSDSSGGFGVSVGPGASFSIGSFDGGDGGGW